MWIIWNTLLRSLFSITIKYFLHHEEFFPRLTFIGCKECLCMNVCNLFWQFSIFGCLDWIHFLLLLNRRQQQVFLNINLSIILPASFGKSHERELLCWQPQWSLLEHSGRLPSQECQPHCHTVPQRSAPGVSTVVLVSFSIFLIINNKQLFYYSTIMYPWNSVLLADS